MPKTTERSAVATPQTNNSTIKEKSHAEILFDKIGTGKEHAYKLDRRNNNDPVQREFRRIVSAHIKDGDVIINEGDGTGYYRPDISRPEEREAAEHYVASLISKANNLMNTAQAIQEKLNGRYMNY